MTVTLMGGDMQAQGRAQISRRVRLARIAGGDHDMARFRHSQIPNVLRSAPSHRVALTAMRRTVQSIDGDAAIGGVQWLIFTPVPRRRRASIVRVRPPQGRPAAAGNLITESVVSRRIQPRSRR
jgi:hypothetical protein